MALAKDDTLRSGEAKTRDASPPLASLDAGRVHFAAGDHPLLGDGAVAGRVMVSFQFIADTPSDTTALCAFSFGGKNFGMELRHPDGSPDVWTSDSVDIRVVSGGTVNYQTWTVPA